MKANERLYESIRAALEIPSDSTKDTAVSEYLRRLVRRNVEAGLWSNSEVLAVLTDPNYVELQFEEPLGDSYNAATWQRVLEFCEGLDSSGRLERTIVRTLNAHIPSAFTTSVGEEYLIVVNNSFHDFLYPLFKLAVVGSDPIPSAEESDPTWRPTAPGYGGRYATAGRLLRLLLGMIRLYGRVYVPITVCLPEALLHHAASMAEASQFFILAHEAGHVTAGHIDVAGRDLLVHGVDASMAGDFAFEHAADDFAMAATKRWMRAALEGREDRHYPWVCSEIAYCFYMALDLFEYAHFVVRPASHPDPHSRLIHVTHNLPELTGITEKNFDVSLAPSLVPMYAIAEQSRQHVADEAPFKEFLATILKSPYFTAHEINAEWFDLLEAVDNFEHILTMPFWSHLEAIADHLLTAEQKASVPGEIWVSVAHSVRDVESSMESVESRARSLIRAAVGRCLVYGDRPEMVRVRKSCWAPAPGTTFEDWIEGFSFVDLPLRAALIALSLHVVREGEDVLWVLEGSAAAELERWVSNLI